MLIIRSYDIINNVVTGGFKMRKRGFTLAEILVSLAVIGIVAALTIPGLVRNVQKNQAGAILGKSVEQLEVGFQNIIQFANDNYDNASYAQTLSAVSVSDLGIENSEDGDSGNNSIVGDGFKGVLSYLGLVPVKVDKIIDIKSFDGTKDATLDTVISDGDLYKFSKTPASVCFQASVSDVNSTDTDEMNKEIASVYIDVNGFDKGPNGFGKDIFRFQIRNSGHLIPYGANTYKTTCSDDSVTDGLACTARVVADGWKIRYY